MKKKGFHLGLVICHSNKARKLREGEKRQREREMTKQTDKISAGALVQQKTKQISQSNMKTADDRYTTESLHGCFAEIST